MMKKTKFIAIGSAGISWAKMVCQNNNTTQDIFAIGTSPTDTKTFSNQIWVDLVFKPCLDNTKKPYKPFQYCATFLLDKETLKNAEYPTQFNEVKKFLQNTDELIILCGLGSKGGFIAPYIGQIAQEMGINTTALVTKPFSWEGPIRQAQAEDAIKLLKEVSKTLTVYDMTLLEKQMPNEEHAKPLFDAADKEILKIAQNTLKS